MIIELETVLGKLLPLFLGLVGALFGGGVVWGLTRAKLAELERRIQGVETRMSTAEAQPVDFAAMCRRVQGDCQVAVHRRLDKVAEDVAFIRGVIETQRRNQG